jgi:plasmid stabilization system protein ParE
MTLVVLRPAARDDLIGSLAWYESQRPGLGSEFLGCVDAALAAIARDPGLATEVADGVRRVLIRRFPFGIYFLSEPDRVVVLAVLHQRRDPRIWRQRQ